MQLHFHKYQGTGNDFILLDNRGKTIALSTEQIAQLCHRRFGIGADGLMLLEPADGYDYRMVYYNADGRESTMCGNGGRCIAAFAQRLGIIQNETSFVAIDGAHTATITPDGTVSLHMQDVANIQHREGYTFLDTGSPHYVTQVADVQAADVVSLGRVIRYDKAFEPGGLNVNFVQPVAGGLHVRTYERGVEGETLSCGTGVTAAAIAASGNALGSFDTTVFTPGGELRVSFTKPAPDAAAGVVLHGAAVWVYEGEVII